MIDPIAAGALLLQALKFGRDVIKSAKVSKAEKQRIAKEAMNLVQLAQMSDIDAEVNRARVGRKASAKKAMKKAVKKMPAKKAATKRRAPAKKSARRRSPLSRI